MRLFVDNLTNIDFSYLCPDRGLVGETWLADIELDGELDEQGMICDFGIVKKIVREWLGRHLDHCLLVPAGSQNIVVESISNQLSVSLKKKDGSTIRIEAPKEAVCLIDCDAITADAVANWSVARIAHEYDTHFSSLKLHLKPEHIIGPYYHYSHGLKKHGGDCQRIAHGHRSKLEIWRNGNLCEESINYWAAAWRDIYIGSKEDCVQSNLDSYVFEYTASQGNFRLEVPTTSCYLIDTDSTVEYIAKHLAEQVGHSYPLDHIVVKAFEGVGKGAIAQYIQPISRAHP